MKTLKNSFRAAADLVEFFKKKKKKLYDKRKNVESVHAIRILNNITE